MRKSKESAKHVRRTSAREFLRSSFVSVFWAAFVDRKKKEGYRLQDLAEATDNDKAQVSRWFSGLPNWQLNTISDIAEALDLEIEVRARHRKWGTLYLPSGPAHVSLPHHYAIKGGDWDTKANPVVSPMASKVPEVT